MQVIGVSVTWHTLLLAGFNMIAPTLLILGIGVFAMGVLPRLTGFITFGIIAWSFLIQMLTSGLNLNHWLLDSSIFSHVAFAPAVDPNWHTSWMLVVIGLILTAIGALVFNRRDLATE
jgi:ABC-2 type transport system permease protein